MRIKKLMSALCVFAISVSTFTIASADTTNDKSLGGIPTAKAEFVEYTTNTSKSWAKAWVKITIDMSAAEKLSAYEETTEYDPVEEDDVLVKKGNGIATAGFALTASEDAFKPQSTNLTKATNWLLEAQATKAFKAAFGPKTLATDYYTEQTAEFIVNFRVSSSDFDKSTKLSLTDVTLGGMNQQAGIWEYAVAASDITIPSYNEWSTPPTPSAKAAVEGKEVNGSKMFSTDTAITVPTEGSLNVKITKDGEGTKTIDENISASENVLGAGTTKIIPIVSYQIGRSNVAVGDVFTIVIKNGDTTVGTWTYTAK